MKFAAKKYKFCLRTAKRVLFFAVLASILYTVGYTFNRPYFFERKIPQVSVSSGKARLISKREEKDYEEFLNKAKSRDIFVSATIREAKNISGIDRGKIISGLTLVGIISGEPKKVVIEDKKSSQTFYLKEGESFLENIVLEKIDKGSVVLNCYGEEFEIYL